MADAWENLDAAFAELEAECTNVIRGMTVDIFKTAVTWSPQSKGVFVSSWQYSLNRPVFWSNPEFANTPPETYMRGNREAIDAAFQANAGDDAPFKLGDIVYISNGAEGLDGEYGVLIEDGTMRLRYENRGGSRPLGRAIDRAGTWYAHTVNPKHAAQLKAIKIY